jgi:hypothetical protein
LSSIRLYCAARGFDDGAKVSNDDAMTVDDASKVSTPEMILKFEILE